MKTEQVIEVLTARFSIDTRAKFWHESAPFNWGWFLVPVPGDGASSAYGLIPTRDREWIDLDPIEQRPIGRRVPTQIIDHTPDLLHQLAMHGSSTQLVAGRI